MSEQYNSRSAQSDSAAANQAPAADKYLIFLTDGLQFGVTASDVVEIITSFHVTTLPMVPDYVSGIINLRGQIIPILDMRLLLGKAYEQSTCIIVLEVAETQLGILVDTGVQMVDIPAQSILPLPTGSDQKLIGGICALAGESSTVMLIEGSMLMQHA